jgi:hypothetical protein
MHQSNNEHVFPAWKRTMKRQNHKLLPTDTGNNVEMSEMSEMPGTHNRWFIN